MQMEDEIDLRKYIDVLIKNAWLVIVMTVLAALAAFVVSRLIRPPIYEATAGILIARTRSQVVFDPRFQTVDSDQVRSASMNEQARREALVALVRNGAIARQVAEQLKGELGRGERNPALLLQMVSGKLWESEESAPRGLYYTDFIAITAASSDPTEAALVANTWATVYEDYVNEVYRDRPESYTSVQEQVVTAQETYEQAEGALTIFVATNQIGTLSRLITEKQQTIDSLQSVRKTIFDQQVANGLQTLTSHYATKRKMERLLQDARALYTQVQAGGRGGAATSNPAIVMLKAEVFATSAGLPGEVLLQLETATETSAQQTDLEALIDVLESRIAELGEAIAEESVTLLYSGGYENHYGPVLSTDAAQAVPSDLVDEVPITQIIDELQQALQGLQAELSTEKATQRELTRARDLAWETYSTLQLKADELNIEAGMVDIEVRFASPAIEPIKPIRSNWQRTVFVAAALGCMVSVTLAFLLHYLGIEYNPWTPIRAFRRRLNSMD
jgi:uncharacterized protein involved in exopolysaccharide biosynthesis